MENIKDKGKNSHLLTLRAGRVGFFLLLFSLFFGEGWGGASTFAQSTNDAGLWTTFNVQKDLKKNVSVFLTQEFRLRENFTRLNLFYTDLGVAVRPFKFLKVSLAYRIIDKFLKDNTFSYRHRLMFDILLKKKTGQFSLSYRHRLQSELRNVNSSANGIVPEWYSRSKFELKYDTDRPVRPYISAEFRYQINDPRNVESNRLLHRQRYSVGLDYKRNDRDTFGFYYLIQNEFNVSAPENIYIVGLEYTLTL
ncbi:MAG: DUF2490 domain-containing protein [Bacteroidota bacterium]|nr:DUF2490 domain-containing protein [Bacteroidota bacterium]